ncbi:MAG: ribonuclease HI family protein [Actinobacteria bacterium]|nr:MAG: ribonuclease HI family protein [Actinomycetota bacterium]
MFYLFVDGAARGNPGPAGVGIVLKEKDKIILKEKAYIGHKTNNEAEYSALIIGLEEAAEFTDKIKVTSDSELLVNQVKGEFKVKQIHLKSLLEKVREIQNSFLVFEIEHSFRENNKEADKLANEAIDEFNEGKREEIKLDYLKQEKLF